MYTVDETAEIEKKAKNEDPELVNKSVVYLLRQRRRFKETGVEGLFTKEKKSGKQVNYEDKVLSLIY